MILGINYDVWHLILAVIAFVGGAYIWRKLLPALMLTISLQALNELKQMIFDISQYNGYEGFVINSIQDWMYASIGIGIGFVAIAILSAFGLWGHNKKSKT